MVRQRPGMFKVCQAAVSRLQQVPAHQPSQLADAERLCLLAVLAIGWVAVHLTMICPRQKTIGSADTGSGYAFRVQCSALCFAIAALLQILSSQACRFCLVAAESAVEDI